MAPNFDRNMREKLFRKDKSNVEEVIQALFDHWNDQTWHGVDQCHICEEFYNFFCTFDKTVLNLLLEKYNASPHEMYAQGAFIYLLGKLGHPEAFDFLVARLNDKNRDVHLSAIAALGHINNTQAVAPLMEVLLKDEDKVARQFAVEALANINLAVEPFLLALKDVDANVRDEAIQVLGVLGDIRAIEPLEQVARNDNGKTWLDKSLKVTANEAISLIKAQAAGTLVLTQMKYSNRIKLLAYERKYT
jgi:HEAT repeat protein